MPKGAIRFAAGAGPLLAVAAGDDARAPVVEFAMRYGVSDDWDVGVKLFTLGAEFGAKHQFLRGPLDMAFAPSASYITFTSGFDEETGNSVSPSFFYLHLPVLMGYNFGDRVTAGFGPKFLWALWGGAATIDNDPLPIKAEGAMLGGFVNLPVRIGRAFWIMPELNVYKHLTADEGVLMQAGLYFLFGGGPPTAP